ncbi:MAG: DUF2630 family protein [Streptosporangiaceae bacterium]
MGDNEVLGRIKGLMDEEHELRTRLAAGELTADDEHARVKAVEEALDQCWDLLRQRRAKQEFSQNPDEAEVRPVREVEGYQQ